MDNIKIVSVDALPDNRPAALKEKDYSALEILDVAAASVIPFKNEPITKLTATEFNQWYVGSCVPHGFLTQLEYEGIATPDISRLRAYRKRANYPSPGSNGVDMYGQIKSGQSTDFPTPQKFTEKLATAMPYVAGVKIIKDFNYFLYVDKKTGNVDISDVPADVALGKAVSIFIYASDKEWSKQYVEATDTIPNPWSAEVRHCVCVVPYGDFTKDGKRWLTIQDSAKFGGRGIRYVEYDTFLKKRCYFAAKVYATGTVPPSPVANDSLPLTRCEQGDRGDSVLSLQTYLVKDGKLAAEYTTGYYGALTAKAVLWWQLEHQADFTANVPQLLEWGGKYWGDQSIKIVKKLNP